MTSTDTAATHHVELAITVTSSTDLDRATVEAAVTEAGYALA